MLSGPFPIDHQSNTALSKIFRELRAPDFRLKIQSDIYRSGF